MGFWRLRRAYRFEAESIAQANKVDPLSKMLDELSKGPTPDRVQHVLPRLQNLDKLVRYESMIDRELLRSMALLQRMQHRRKLDEEPSDPFNTTPASNPSAEARRSTDRRREEDQGSRKCGSRISDCELRNRERTSGLGRHASGRSVKPDARSPKASSPPRLTTHASRSPDRRLRKNPSGRTNPIAPITNGANRLRSTRALRTPQNAHGGQRAAGFGPCGSTNGENATHGDRPRGLEAHGSGERRTSDQKELAVGEMGGG